MRKRFDDQRLANALGQLLRVGVLTAAAIVIVGGAAYMLRHHSAVVELGVFRGEPAGLRSVLGIVRGALALDSLAWVQLGLLVLIATPTMRVAFAVVAFALEGDPLYVGISAVVLAVILGSLNGIF
jgi:uncharacterized membrane protein